MTKTVPKIKAVHYCSDLQDLLICSENESKPPKWRVKICYHNIHNQATSGLARPRISFLATKNYRQVFERSQTSVTLKNGCIFRCFTINVNWNKLSGSNLLIFVVKISTNFGRHNFFIDLPIFIRVTFILACVFVCQLSLSLRSHFCKKRNLEISKKVFDLCLSLRTF